MTDCSTLDVLREMAKDPDRLRQLVWRAHGITQRVGCIFSKINKIDLRDQPQQAVPSGELHYLRMEIAELEAIVKPLAEMLEVKATGEPAPDVTP